MHPFFAIIVTLLTLLSATCIFAKEPCYPDQYPFNQEECIEITRLKWDLDNSASEIAVSGSGAVFVLNGQEPFVWQINGNGIAFDPDGNITEMETNVRSINVYNLDQCGSAVITVTDHCETTVKGTVQSEEGTWVLVEEGTTNCPFTAPKEEWERQPYQPFIKIEGNIRVKQYSSNYVGGGGRCDFLENPYYGCGNLECTQLDPPDDFKGCVTDLCKPGAGFLAGDKYIQCGGECKWFYIDHCGNGTHPSVPGQTRRGCLGSSQTISVNVEEWQCP